MKAELTAEVARYQEIIALLDLSICNLKRQLDTVPATRENKTRRQLEGQLNYLTVTKRDFFSISASLSEHIETLREKKVKE